MELNPRSRTVAPTEDKKAAASKFHVRFISVRKRLCDPDNLCCKFLLDALRYHGFIPGDEPDKIELEVTQRKCVKGEAEKTVIEVSQL